ncbi:hypothetical protein MSAN_00551100 [Mycena sanguinolenta]|uniref:Uncharacterized protein n=1 Tax=Mycena sanguinolenta TaxID=230812 RepID=A0A8H6ZCZ5_9AGAR|nr:hypothetical protein MSAN_00551100 [Mycena sanguinolenta]
MRYRVPSRLRHSNATERPLAQRAPHPSLATTPCRLLVLQTRHPAVARVEPHASVLLVPASRSLGYITNARLSEHMALSTAPRTLILAIRSRGAACAPTRGPSRPRLSLSRLADTVSTLKSSNVQNPRVHPTFPVLLPNARAADGCTVVRSARHLDAETGMPLAHTCKFRQLREPSRARSRPRPRVPLSIENWFAPRSLRVRHAPNFPVRTQDVPDTQRTRSAGLAGCARNKHPAVDTRAGAKTGDRASTMRVERALAAAMRRAVSMNTLFFTMGRIRVTTGNLQLAGAAAA